MDHHTRGVIRVSKWARARACAQIPWRARVSRRAFFLNEYRLAAARARSKRARVRGLGARARLALARVRARDHTPTSHYFTSVPPPFDPIFFDSKGGVTLSSDFSFTFLLGRIYQLSKSPKTRGGHTNEIV